MNTLIIQFRDRQKSKRKRKEVREAQEQRAKDMDNNQRAPLTIIRLDQITSPDYRPMRHCRSCSRFN